MPGGAVAGQGRHSLNHSHDVARHNPCIDRLAQPACRFLVIDPGAKTLLDAATDFSQRILHIGGG